MSERKITGRNDAITTIEENGKLYVMKDCGEGKPRSSRRTYTYVETNKDEYLARIKKLAQDVVSSPGVKASDIIEDALMDYNLDDIERIETALSEERARAKETEQPERVRTKPGHCCEIYIGRSPLFTIRG